MIIRSLTTNSIDVEYLGIKMNGGKVEKSTRSFKGMKLACYSIVILFLTMLGPKANAQPTLTVKAPLDYTVAYPKLEIDATCTTSLPGGTKLKVYIYGSTSIPNMLADVPGKIKKTFDLSPYYKIYLFVTYIRFICEDSFGKHVMKDRPIIVETSSKLKEVRTVDGYILDADDTRILYVKDNRLMVHERLSWRNSTIYALAGNEEISEGYLGPKGVLFIANTKDWQGIGKTYHWRNSTLSLLYKSRGSRLIVKGNYASYSNSAGIFIRDLIKNTEKLITKTGEYAHLSVNGEVCIEEKGGIYRFRNNKMTKIASGIQCMIDSKNVIYQKSSFPFTTLALFTNAGEVVIGKDAGKKGYSYYFHYRINNGWTAYVLDDGRGTYQLYLRYPSGSSSRVTNYKDSISRIGAVGNNGEVWYDYNRDTYYKELGKSAIRISILGGRIFYIKNRWHVGMGRSLFLVRPYLSWPDGGISTPDMGPPDLGPEDISIDISSDSKANDKNFDKKPIKDQENPEKSFEDSGKHGGNNEDGGCAGCIVSSNSVFPNGKFTLEIIVLLLGCIVFYNRKR